VVSESQINLSWTDNSGTEDGFTVERALFVSPQLAPQWSQIATTSMNVTIYSDDGLGCGAHLYRTRAYKLALVSGYSNIATASTTSVDSDADGVADCWTRQYFGHPTGQANDNSLAASDADGDGL